MRKFTYLFTAIFLLLGLALPISINAQTSPGSFPNTLYRGTLVYGTSPDDITVHVYTKCFDNNPPNGQWFVEFVVQYDNESPAQIAASTIVTGDPGSGVTTVGSDSKNVAAGGVGSPITEISLIPGASASYTTIVVDVTIDAANQTLPLASASCGPSNVSLSSASASVADQGWLLLIPLALLAVVTAVLLRRRVQVQA